MSNFIEVKSAKGGAEPIKPGTYDAVLTAFVLLGVHDKKYKGEITGQAAHCKLIFEIPSLLNEEGVARTVGKEMPISISDRANFFKYFKNMGLVQSAEKADFDKIFATKESVDAILGTAVGVTIAQFVKDDGKAIHYIENVAKLDPRLPQPEPVAEPFVFNFGAPDLDVFKNKLTKFLRAKVMSAHNVKDLPKEFHEAYIAEQEAENGDGPAPKTGTDRAKDVI